MTTYMCKDIIQQTLTALLAQPIATYVVWKDGVAVDALLAHSVLRRDAIKALQAALAAQNSEHVNKCTATAPEVIYLCVSDEPEDANLPYDSHEMPYQDEGVTWSRNAPVAVSVKYIRSDLAWEAAIPGQVKFHTDSAGPENPTSTR